MDRKLFFFISFILVIFLAARPANSALVSHWTFDEGSGNIAYDSANGHNGTISGAAWTTGIIGGALDFDGVDDYVNFGDIDEFEFGDHDFSICAWFYTEGPHNIPGTLHDGQIISKYDWGSNRRQWFLIQESAGNTIFYTSPDGFTHEHLFSTSDGYKNQWVHIACVRSGSTKFIYLNGELDSTGTTDGVVTGKSTKVFVGFHENVGVKTRFFNGLIDDVRIYNHALTQSEIQQLIPEPASILLLGLGGLILRKRREIG